MPCVAPVCEGMHYHKTGVPWQMKSIFIIVLFLLDLPRNALVCKGFRRFVKCVILLASWQNRARWSKLLRAVSSKIGSKRKFLLLRIFILNIYSNASMITNPIVLKTNITKYFMKIHIC